MPTPSFKAASVLASLFATTILTPAYAHAPAEKVIYSFQGAVAGDGADPRAGLIDVGGMLYGTTIQGGAHGYGTVFKVTTAGAEAVLYSFQGLPNSDGDGPRAGLIDVDGTLYGTTAGGGASQLGTVFKVTLAGAETVLYSFGGPATNDGAFPYAGLVNLGGTLYGTTLNGGQSDGGIVFKVTRAGVETQLHSFGGNTTGDGLSPFSGLMALGGTLYGTTLEDTGVGQGTVYALSPGKRRAPATETVLYTFQGVGDGVLPVGGLVNVNGTFYGTTSGGGTVGNGYGTVFKIAPGGSGYAALYSFQGQAAGDGAAPYAGLIDVNGTLYGTTTQGGTNGYGTVFKVTPSGVETVLHSFQGQAAGDGAYPYAELIKIGDMLYGTTEQGGANGYGTVFAIKL